MLYYILLYYTKITLYYIMLYYIMLYYHIQLYYTISYYILYYKSSFQIISKANRLGPSHGHAWSNVTQLDVPHFYRFLLCPKRLGDKTICTLLFWQPMLLKTKALNAFAATQQYTKMCPRTLPLRIQVYMKQPPKRKDKGRSSI